MLAGGAVAKRHRENAGLGAVVKRLAALWRSATRKTLHPGRCAVANSHREDANQHRGATAIGSASAKRHWEDTARREMLRCEAQSGRCKPAPGSNCERKCQWRSAIGKMLPAGRCAKEKHREDANDRELHQGAAPGSSIGKPHRREGRWQERSSEC